MSEDFHAMRVVSLTVENVMGVRAIEIEPDGNVIAVGGDNAQGKTSVLDALWMALSPQTDHKKNPDPIHHGAKSGSVAVDLGDLLIHREWRLTDAGETTSKLVVTDPENRPYSSPAALLKRLMGKTFDPMAFMRLGPTDQVSALLSIVDVGLDLDANARERERLFLNRQDVHRELLRLRGNVDNLPEPPEIGPGWNLDTQALQDEIRSLRAADEDVRRAGRDYEYRAADVIEAQTSIDELSRQLAGAKEALKVATAERFAADKAEADLLMAREKLRSVDDAAAELAAVAERAELVRQKRDHDAALYDRDDTKERWTALDGAIGELDRARAEAIAAADMPVAGLSFGVDGLTYEGVPLTQASQAQQIRVCVAMAMASNPTIRVARVSDGALLDTKSRELLAELADVYNFQVWLEVVGDSEPSALIIEAGLLRHDS